jgi:uncharacterized protein YdhG (YjbR/CyaY superfamily)
MRSTHGTWTSIDAYIAAAPPDQQVLLRDLRAAIHAAAPAAAETISYGMPAFAQNGTLVCFAALKDGIGFYPTSSGIAAFQEEVSRYTGTKGAVRFPLGQPLPLDLISRIVRFRVEENRTKAADKTTRTTPRTRGPVGAPPTAGAAGAPPAATAFPRGMGAPATRALTAAGYTDLRQLAGVPVADLRRLHGMGPKALARLQEALDQEGLSLG